ncbi:DNA repair protein RadA [Actinomyces vulturis]|uniref:DNA repair protein RadA n=1 Tax=Actinomyces vulturis TaxID=1857645 RepID=UPI000829D089|nr:DNA repair protein RadA [Actinomyces vulturis]
MATHKSPAYRCSECGQAYPKWVGQCRHCQSWGSVEETQSPSMVLRSTTVTSPITPALPIAEVNREQAQARSTGVGEFDRVLGGGIVPGAVVLLAGEPGVGKSTLLLDVAAQAARQARQHGWGPVLYVTGEESASQVRLRAERINALDDDLLLAAETDLGALLGHVEAVNPSLLVVDSVQTIASSQVDGSAGGVTQVRAVSAALIAVAKERAIPVLLVGHVTKDGAIAGPRVLEHLVDVVCQCEGERHGRLRLLRAVKNRFGPTDEVGCFDLNERGIEGLADPSGLFLSAARSQVPGTCATVTLEGRRPMPVEIQALVAPTHAGSPRRTTSGMDHARVAMTLAVLGARLRVDTSSSDVYVSTVGGARAVEPATDVAVAIAVVSAARNLPTAPHLVAFGEVGLTGEVRATSGIERRLIEASRLGFTQAIIPAHGQSEIKKVPGIEVITVNNLAHAIDAALNTSD